MRARPRSPGRPASTCCRSARPKAARSRPKPWCFSIRARGREHGRAAKARRPSPVQAPLSGAAVRGVPGRTIAGCGSRATPMPWPTGWPRGSPPPAPRRSGRSRPIWFSSSLPKAVDARLEGRRRALLCAAQRKPARRHWSRTSAGAAGDLVRHARGRGRSLRRACRKGVRRLPQAAPQFAAAGVPERGDSRCGRCGGGEFSWSDESFMPRLPCWLFRAPAAAQGYEPAPLPGSPAPRIISIAALDRFRAARSAGAARHELRAARDRRSRPRGPCRGRCALRRDPVGDAGQIASRMPPPRGGVTMGRRSADAAGLRSSAYRSDAYRTPPGGYRAGAPAVGPDDGPDIYRNLNAPRPPGPLPGAFPSRSSNAAPLPPRGGAMPPATKPRHRRNRMSSPPSPTVAACCRRRRSVSRSALRRLRRRSPSRCTRAAATPLPQAEAAANAEAAAASAHRPRPRRLRHRAAGAPKRRRTARSRR